MQITIEQSELLYQIAEIHLDWILKYNPDSNTTFEDMLKINHRKLTSCFIGDSYTQADVTDKLYDMRAHVLRLKTDYLY